MVQQISNQEQPSTKRREAPLEDLCAEDLMTEEPLTIEPGTPVAEAIALMSKLEIRHLPVVAGGRLVGVLSDRDLASVTHDREARPAAMAQPIVRHIARAPVFVTKSAPIRDIIDVLVSNRIGAVPVVDEGHKLSGIVSYVDVLRAVRDDLG